MTAVRRDLTQGPLGQHFRAMAIPAAIGMTFSTLYNVVDVYYAGLLSTDAQAGLSIAFQAFFLLIAFGIGLGSAMSALVGNAIGDAMTDEARRMATQGLSFALMGSVTLMVAGLVVGPLLLSITSEPGPYRVAANRYFLFLLLAMPGFIIAYGLNGVLQAHGDAISMQRALVAAFFANLLLNPLFVFGIPGVFPAIGFDGIALSTVVSQSGVAIYLMVRAVRSGALGPITWSDLVPDFDAYRTIAGQLVPSCFAMVVMISVGIIIQFYLKSFGPSAVAAYGVALRVEQLFLLPAFGLTGALLPIAAQNAGAGKGDRVRGALLTCIGIGLVYMLFASPVLWLAGRYLMQFFASDPEVVRIGVSYLRVDSIIFPAYLALFAINSFLQALKQPRWVLFIGIYRQALAVPVFIWLFVSIGGFGVHGVWFGVAASVVTGLALALVVAHRVSHPTTGGLWRRRSVSP